jgi:hypothetical protein
MKTRTIKRKSIKKTPRKQFTCLVDVDLLIEANEKRKESWPAILEDMLRTVASRGSLK